MLKRIISVLALTFILGVQTFGATFTTDGVTKTPLTITTKDFDRLLQVVRNVSGEENVKIINLQMINNTTYAVRIRRGQDQTNDYIITTIPYTYNAELQKVTSLPFKNVEDGNKMYGKNWYYFGLISDVGNEICGFGLAERIKRWSGWEDLQYTGITDSGKAYIGSYSLPCSEDFQY